MVEIIQAVLTAAAIGIAVSIALVAIVVAWSKAESPASHVDDESGLEKTN